MQLTLTNSVRSRSAFLVIWMLAGGDLAVADDKSPSPVVKATNKLPSLEPQVPGGQIRGKVVDTVTGKPAAFVTVTVQPTKQSSVGMSDFQGWQTATTNAEGEYLFPNLTAREYNIWASADDRACAALNSVSVVVNETHGATDLQLVEGGWLEGRVMTLKGQPVSRDFETGERLNVGLNGPSRPRTGASFESHPVDDNGRFRLRVPAGRNFIFLISHAAWDRTWRREKFERGIDVESGQTVAVNFRIHDKPPKTPPPPRPNRDPVKLPTAVVSERDAAETIRDLGGWYLLDQDGHVVEINMVYHDATGVRYDNKYTDSDEALRIAAAFPRLKRLFLHKGQATDESMACLADLEGLETFFIWDGTAISDAGGIHLARLTNLTNVHLGSCGIGDQTLAALAKLEKVSQMSLQGNAFTDAGLAHLANAQQLRSLWVGLSKGSITDAGLAHLAGLEKLEQLEVQQTQVTAEGVAGLQEKLPNLKIIK